MTDDSRNKSVETPPHTEDDQNKDLYAQDHIPSLTDQTTFVTVGDQVHNTQNDTVAVEDFF